ncbi:RNA-directed DNA polymerase, eukaryota, reverse transcriptase zinc-binding domain protein [Tanacetum coccineum]
MSNRKRSSKRKPKLPNKFNDHIMSNLSQQRKDSSDFDEIDEIRVRKEDMVGKIGEIRECSKEMETDCGNGGDESIIGDNEAFGRNSEKVMEDNVEMPEKMNKGVFGSAKQNEPNSTDVADRSTNSGIPHDPKNISVDSNHNSFVNDLHNTENKTESNMKSYANKLTSGMDHFDNELFFVPTQMKDNGEKVVIFDEDLVKEGSEKWKYTVCGYFVGYNMGIYELRYNIRRMWGKFGLKDSVVDADGMCYFKFKNEEGMNSVIDQSPWLVNGKPLLVQKWDPEITIVKESPCKIPIWLKLVNVPLEAWNVRGISALASRLGRPIKMDQVTAEMCREGTGRLWYARVLVEVNADDEFFDKIEINYVDEMKQVKNTKWVRVEYTWKPDRCSHCKVFGHSAMNCGMKPKPKNTVNYNEKTAAAGDKNGSLNKEGFVEVNYRKNNNKKVWTKEHQGYRQQTAGVKVTYKPKESANKYAVLSDEENNNEEDVYIDKRLIVDEFIKKKVQPTFEETKNWNYDMITYFKIRWEAMERKDMESSDGEDVFEVTDHSTQNFIADEIRGKGSGLAEGDGVGGN